MPLWIVHSTVLSLLVLMQSLRLGDANNHLHFRIQHFEDVTQSLCVADLSGEGA